MPKRSELTGEQRREAVLALLRPEEWLGAKCSEEILRVAFHRG